MARSFLFAQTSADAATTRLIATAAQVTGFMKGEPGSARPGWYQPGADNRPFMAELRGALAATYPAAGPAFWAVRLWTNLLWQPAYLAVIGAHLHGALPALSGLSQQRSGIYVDGYRLLPGPLLEGDTEALIAAGAGQLKAMSEQLFAEVNSQEKLKPLPARRLLADRMLSLMVWLGQRRRNISPEQLADYAAVWLEGMGLTGQGTLERVAAGGRSVMIVKRKGCCLDYLIAPQAFCATCPKQDNDLRIARQVTNALAELD